MIRPGQRRYITAAAMTVAIAAAVAILTMLYRMRHTGIFFAPEYEITGIDVSSHNGPIDFEAVRNSGMEFAYVKASEGQSFKDLRFYDNITSARDAGLKVGAYHFFRFDVSPYMQTINFLNSIEGQQLDLPLAIDVEEWSNPDGFHNDSVAAAVTLMARQLRSVGYNVIIYTNKEGLDKYIDSRLKIFPLWLCSLGAVEEATPWTFHQYTHRGRVDGIKGNVDINGFNGDISRWQAWLDSIAGGRSEIPMNSPLKPPAKELTQ